MCTKSALVMATSSCDLALANQLISQYELSKHLCDRLRYADRRDRRLYLASRLRRHRRLSWEDIGAARLPNWNV
jgi:hypothetical protein